MPVKIYLARPRGFCAGVDRAIEIVERTIERFGAPVYVRHEIVHNAVVVAELRAKGAIFVGDVAEVPPGGLIVFSAHGVSPQVVAQAEARRLRIVDATCPLVTKVHIGAKAWSHKHYTILLAGHKDHVEVDGVVGEAEDCTIVVETVADAEKIEVEDPHRVAILTQTTLSVDEANDIIAVLRRRFPDLVLPHNDDICYATQNRQDAVKALTPLVDVWLVIGDPTSSNSNRLRELGESHGVPSYLILGAGELRPEWVAGASAVGVTSGASTPEVSVQRVLARLRALGATEVVESEGPTEDIVFSLPVFLRSLAH